jgi:hypothetical protein
VTIDADRVDLLRILLQPVFDPDFMVPADVQVVLISGYIFSHSF